MTVVEWVIFAGALLVIGGVLLALVRWVVKCTTAPVMARLVGIERQLADIRDRLTDKH